MNLPDWNKKPDWAAVWIESFSACSKSQWAKNASDRWILSHGFWWKADESPELYKVHYQPTEVTIPPVGTECEIKPYWHKVLVVAHDVREEGVRIVFWDYHDSVYSYTCRSDLFRPIKSHKEQWVDTACDYLGKKLGVPSPNYRSYMEHTYDGLASGKLKLDMVKTATSEDS